MKSHLVNYLAIGGAGFLGAITRYAVGNLCVRLFGQAFLGTFVINISGCFLLACFATLLSARLSLPEPARLAIAVGFTGAYTTFSTFAYESHALFENGAPGKALFNLFGSLLAGLLAIRLGILVAQR